MYHNYWNELLVLALQAVSILLLDLRTTRLTVVLAEMTAQLPHWAVYKEALAQLAIGVEHHRG